MGASSDQTRSARAWGLAQRQHGVLARRQLLALGFTAKAIRNRIERGRLHPVSRGVYAVGRPELSREGHWMTAILACGDGAALSHRSAMALWGIGTDAPGRIDVSVRAHTRVRRPGLRVRRRPGLPDADVVGHRGIPVTSPARTLVDLATELGPIAVERAVNEADKRDLIDPETLRTELERYAGEPGVRLLRQILDKRTFRLSDSELEILFRRIAIGAGLPPPLTKQKVNGFEVDFYWPDLGLVVETDGLRYHRTPSAQARDAERDRAHVLAGMTPLRFTHYEVKYEPARVREELTRLA